MMENKIKLMASITAVLAFVIYFMEPTLGYGFIGIPIFILIVGFILFLVSDFEHKATLIAGVILTVFLPFVTSAPIFHSSSYQSLLGPLKENVFSKDISPIDITKVRVVDQALARKLGDKLLGSNPALGSIVELGEFSIQSVNKKLYWVSPMLHSGFFKWLNSDNGTPGYIMVSATNQQDVQMVTEVNGKKIFLKYQPNAYFSENLRRHVYFNGFMTTGLADYSFELDENLNPFYVITIYEKKIGFSGSDATGVLILNPQTGEIKTYKKNEIPEWVDRVQPEEFIANQIDSFGQYGKGWLNSIFSQEDVLTMSPGMSLVYGEDGNSYWYTGMTSAGTDGSTVGFMLVNTKTKEIKWYKQSGATENIAARSAEDEVQEKGYKSTSPILYNVLGIPTYVSTLKGNSGLVKLIAFISVEHHSIVGTGKTIKAALRDYKALLSEKTEGIILSSGIETIKRSGVIKEISQVIKNGNSVFYFQLQDINSKNVYIVNPILSEDIVLTQIGDTVSIEYEIDSNQYIDLVNFKNTNF